jgi:hypothetical protein
VSHRLDHLDAPAPASESQRRKHDARRPVERLQRVDVRGEPHPWRAAEGAHRLTRVSPRHSHGRVGRRRPQERKDLLEKPPDGINIRLVVERSDEQQLPASRLDRDRGVRGGDAVGQDPNRSADVTDALALDLGGYEHTIEELTAATLLASEHRDAETAIETLQASDAGP